MSQLLRLSDAVDDVRYDTALDCLRSALRLTEDEPDFKATGAVVLLLDETGGGFQLRRLCSGMRTSEVVAALTIAVHQELRDLERTL